MRSTFCEATFNLAGLTHFTHPAANSTRRYNSRVLLTLVTRCIKLQTALFLTPMKKKIKLTDITIRTELRPGDIGYVIYMHGHLYKTEYNYGIEFETYVAAGLAEFYQQYDREKDRVWICEHKNKIVGFLLLMHRGDAAQLRY